MSFYKQLCKLYKSAREINLPAPHRLAKVIDQDDVALIFENRERYIAQSKHGSLAARQPLSLYAKNTGVEL
jgi:hypothetical protein